MEFPVSAAKINDLNERLSRLGIRDADLDEKFIRGGGAGGQKINKTSSTVVLVHLPTGTEVRCQASRSQAMNRFLARRLLVEKIEDLRFARASQKQQEIEKLRRQKRKRSKRAKEKVLLDKKKHSEKKSTRQKPSY